LDQPEVIAEDDPVLDDQVRTADREAFEETTPGSLSTLASQ